MNVVEHRMDRLQSWVAAHKAAGLPNVISEIEGHGYTAGGIWPTVRAGDVEWLVECLEEAWQECAAQLGDRDRVIADRKARAEALEIAANIFAARTPTGALTGHTFELVVLARWIVDGTVAPEPTADQDGTTEPEPEPEALVDRDGLTWHRVAPDAYTSHRGTAGCSRAEIERACGPVRPVRGEGQ